jgi:starvation-inducible DNA-binding protein
MAQAQAQLNHIGLETEKAEQIASTLNTVLSAYQIHYQNLRGFHWNVKGHVFFELHEKFEELYEEAKNSIDEIAERILTLGYTPLHTMSDYLETTGVTEAKNVSNDKDTVKHTIRDLQGLLVKEREAWRLANEISDVGTTHLLEDYIGSQEKTIWMLNSWLNKNTIDING